MDGSIQPPSPTRWCRRLEPARATTWQTGEFRFLDDQTFRIAEKQTLHFRMEMFNSANPVELGNGHWVRKLERVAAGDA
jgi:hypothetical protein